MRDFVCPDCGAVIRDDASTNRKRCPRCAYEWQKRKALENAKKQRERMREENKIKKKAGRKPKEKPQPSPAAQKQKEADARQNARIREQRRQCNSCRWRMYDAASRRTVGCDFLLKNGHMRDRGEGPGKCGSFEPFKQKESKAERVKRACKNLSDMEANNAWNTGGRLRKENG